MLKCVTDAAGLTPAVERVIRAVAAAQIQTGAPILTHTDAATRQGLAQQRILADSGVDLGRVVIGHTDDTDDMDYAEERLRNGSYVGLDRFGYNGPRTLDERIDLLLTLCSHGWIKRIVRFARLGLLQQLDGHGSHGQGRPRLRTPAHFDEDCSAVARPWLYTCGH